MEVRPMRNCKGTYPMGGEDIPSIAVIGYGCPISCEGWYSRRPAIKPRSPHMDDLLK